MKSKLLWIHDVHKHNYRQKTNKKNVNQYSPFGQVQDLVLAHVLFCIHTPGLSKKNKAILATENKSVGIVTNKL
jgi:hypothetical protein